jgi:hypothetical protein
MAYMASDPCTETSDRTPESPASNSRQANPYATAEAPAQPYPVRCMPSRPTAPNSTANSRIGASPISYQPATCGRTRVATSWLTTDRIWRSSSLS